MSSKNMSGFTVFLNDTLSKAHAVGFTFFFNELRGLLVLDDE